MLQNLVLVLTCLIPAGFQTKAQIFYSYLTEPAYAKQCYCMLFSYFHTMLKMLNLSFMSREKNNQTFMEVAVTREMR